MYLIIEYLSVPFIKSFKVHYALPIIFVNIHSLIILPLISILFYFLNFLSHCHYFFLQFLRSTYLNNWFIFIFISLMFLFLSYYEILWYIFNLNTRLRNQLVHFYVHFINKFRFIDFFRSFLQNFRIHLSCKL